MKHGVCSAFWLPPIPHRQKHGYSITRWWTRYTACILKHNKGSWSIRLCHLVSLTGWQLCACVWCKLSSGADRRRWPLSCNPEPLLFNESLWAAGNTQIVCWDSCAPRFLSQSLCVCVCVWKWCAVRVSISSQMQMCALWRLMTCAQYSR